MTRASKTAKAASRFKSAAASHTNTAPAPKPPNAAWFCPILLVAAGVAVYANSLSGPFLFDDLETIIEQPERSDFWFLWKTLSEPPHWALTGRPVARFTFALNYWLGGRDVRGYHAVNLAIHLACALTLFGIVERTLRREVFMGRFPRAGPWPALLVALIFTVHPLQTESVSYITQRTELLAGVFFLFTLYAAIRAWEASRPGFWTCAAIVSCALGMGSKEVMAAAPLMILLYDWVFTRVPIRGLLRRRAWLYVGLATTWMILAALLWTAPRSLTIGFGLGISALDYLRTQAGVILHYFRLVFWPDPLVLSYDWPVVHTWSECLPQFVIVAALGVATVYGLSRRSRVGFLGAWCFLILGPTSSFVPLVTEVAAERRMYLPLAAVACLLVVGGWRCLAVLNQRIPTRSGVIRTLGAAAAVAMLASLGYRTLRRNVNYQDALAMWTDVARLRPDNPWAYVHMAWYLEKRGEVEAAINAYRKALALYPNFAVAHYNLGLALLGQNRTHEAETAFRHSLRLTPENPAAHLHLADILMKHGDPEGATAEYRAALKIAPEDAEAAVNLANALRRLGRPAEALEVAKLAVRASPQSAAAHEALAHAFLAQGNMASAAVEFRLAAQFDPANLSARVNLGTALMVEDRIEEAIVAYREAIRINSRSFHAHFLLADALMTQGKHHEAIAEFEAAMEISPRDADVHVALGHALRAVGRTTEAAEHFRNALTVNPNRTDARNALSEMGLRPES